MEKIAIISDIHGNLTALNAVFEDIQKRAIDRIICLGDLAGKGPHSAEAIDLVKEKCEIVVKGNWDFFMTEVNDSDVISWHRNKIGKMREAYLRALPMYAEFYISGKLIRLCHASPQDVFNRVHKWTPDQMRLTLFEATPTLNLESDIVGYGDIHGAYVDSIGEKIIFNVGSVGNPLDFNLASYGIIEGDIESVDCFEQHGSKNPDNLSSIAIAIVRVPYDIEQAVMEAVSVDMPELEEYIIELRTAVYRGRK
ncbi:metallophosphoesterase family protein [Fusibacter bizertensis]